MEKQQRFSVRATRNTQRAVWTVAFLVLNLSVHIVATKL